VTVFRAYTANPCHGSVDPADDRIVCSNGQTRLGIPILPFEPARDLEYQWIHFNQLDDDGIASEIERCIEMNPKTTLILGDEVNAPATLHQPPLSRHQQLVSHRQMSAEEYARAYVRWFRFIKHRSPITRLSTCGFAANADPFGFAGDFITTARESCDVDEFRFNAAVDDGFSAFREYLEAAKSFTEGHGYRNYCIGSFYADAGMTKAKLRGAMLTINSLGYVKEAVYWGFEHFTTDVLNPLGYYDGQVPHLNELGRMFVETAIDLGEANALGLSHLPRPTRSLI
jgi:hypothetical protein